MTTRLAPGDTAPAFSLDDADGARVSLEDYRGRNVVVYFYPKAATPGCTTEACDFRDSLSSLDAAGYSVIGISPDEVADIRAFSDAEGLTFPLLADTDAAVARAWGVWGEKTVGDRTFDGVIRSTFVLDGDGVVQRAEYGVDATGHVARLREELGV
ncbi:thioredoxin-dependent thiol peroxidase [Microbacterium azadirachtae]|uniref:thioredoxin-dependent thiol peroxidase n=1 Tax=Microbacterium azadirachtae TaxID=582680 RepID=UPI00088BD50C|nr:thioredoxin-dependent thiol peroxidase [Microbacterium azadirachtae]SDL75705.1 peroxiredoxin Q/BCP [Microbacterium azadirachtae]SEG04960.1 peroxiredoxin Q/BCP [Microbacterium azadirachtae]SEG07636.1 peroxiredoxin Q/BCP [Microbacterium azadirachtae]